MSLKLSKENNPVKIAEFSQSRDIFDKPAFCWWVPYTLTNQDRIIAAVNACVRRITHKYGTDVPTSVDHANHIDASNGNLFYQEFIDKEITNVAVAF